MAAHAETDHKTHLRGQSATSWVLWWFQSNTAFIISMYNYENHTETALVSSDKQEKYLNPIHRARYLSEPVWNFWPGSICASKNSVNVILLVAGVGTGQSLGTEWDSKVSKGDTRHEEEQICSSCFVIQLQFQKKPQKNCLKLNGAIKLNCRKSCTWACKKIPCC